MKKYILPVILFVVIVGSATAVGLHYINSYHEKRQAENTQINNQIADISKKVDAVKAENATLSAKNAQLLAECQKGTVAYEALPAATKAKTPGPVCPTN